jgi:hypothetical protein
MGMTVVQTVKEIRTIATRNGLTFRVDKRKYINNSVAYLFVDTKTKQIVLENMNIAMAYNNACSGFIDSYNIEMGCFNGVNHEQV